MPVLLSYRNQSTDLHSKSIDWFLYEGNNDIYWVNKEADAIVLQWLFTRGYSNVLQVQTNLLVPR